MFIANIGCGVILPTLPFLSRHIGATSFEMGLALSVFAITQLLSSSLWGVLSDRLGRRPVLIFGIVGYGVSSALLGFAPRVAVSPLFFLGCSDVPHDRRLPDLGVCGTQAQSADARK
jgi:MFS family permease